MASWIYAVSVEQTGPEFTNETEVSGAWSHESATRWARVEGCKLPVGTVIKVWRWRDGPGRLPRQGNGEQHRRYVVNEDGIVRRTDR